MHRSIHIILLIITLLALFMPYISIVFDGQTFVTASGIDLMFALPIKSDNEEVNMWLGVLPSRVADFLSGKTRQWDLFLIGIALFSCVSISLCFVKNWSEKPIFAIIYLVNLFLIFLNKLVYLELWQEQTTAFFKTLPEEIVDMVPKDMVFLEFASAWWAILFINSIGIIWMIWRLIEIKRDRQLTIYQVSEN
jgi:hypothetical protein